MYWLSSNVVCNYFHCAVDCACPGNSQFLNQTKGKSSIFSVLIPNLLVSYGVTKIPTYSVFSSKIFKCLYVWTPESTGYTCTVYSFKIWGCHSCHLPRNPAIISWDANSNHHWMLIKSFHFASNHFCACAGNPCFSSRQRKSIPFFWILILPSLFSRWEYKKLSKYLLIQSTFLTLTVYFVKKIIIYCFKKLCFWKLILC